MALGGSWGIRSEGIPPDAPASTEKRDSLLHNGLHSRKAVSQPLQPLWVCFLAHGGGGKAKALQAMAL